MTQDQDVDTRFELDDRQRAMLAEMGVRIWLPKKLPTAIVSSPVMAQSVTQEAPSSSVADTPAIKPLASSPAPQLVSMPVVDISALPEGIAQMDWPLSLIHI